MSKEVEVEVDREAEVEYESKDVLDFISIILAV